MQQATDASHSPAPQLAAPVAESSVRRTVLLFIVIIIVALLGVFASRFSVSPRGAASPALLVATQPALAIAAALAAMIVALLIALTLAKPINAVVSLFALGCAFAAYAMQTGTIADFVFLNTNMKLAAVETIAWSVFIAIAAMIAFRVGGALVDVPAHNRDGTFTGEIFHKRALMSLLAGVVSIPVLIFTMIGASKGQAIGACVIAGVITSVIGRLIAPRAQPILLFAMPALAIGVAQLALAFATTISPDIAFVNATLSPIRVPMPMDIAAGSLIGVAIGLGWSKGLVKHEPSSLHDE
ncbi:MAG: hypothetical protein EXS12_08655 [Phycisphaerales bacterium]|nr:hypothetical protein [Phycisphaerales bacterium]